MGLYEHPCNLFVAGFIGSPGMNFIAATVQQASAHGATVKLGGGESIRCAVDAGSAQPGDKVTLGVRPEHLRAGVADNALNTTVTFVESLGSMTYAYCSNPGLEDVITCAVEGDRRIDAGSALPLAVPVDKTYLFDAQGQAFQRLGAIEHRHAA
jgi:multiple sugar transport system ATP-binding protein